MYHDGVLEGKEYQVVREEREAPLVAEPVRDHAWVKRTFAVVREEPHRVVAGGAYRQCYQVGIETAIVFDFGHDRRVSAFAAYLLAEPFDPTRDHRAQTCRVADKGVKLYEAEARGLLETHASFLRAIPYRG